MRDSVKQFAGCMEDVLIENDSKGGWDKCGVKYLLSRLEDNFIELTTIVNCKIIDLDNSLDSEMKKARGNLIDIANYCMMLHQVLK